MDRDTFDREAARDVAQAHGRQHAVVRPVESDGDDARRSLERETVAGRGLADLTGGRQRLGITDGAVAAHVEVYVGRDEEGAVVGGCRGNRHQTDGRRVAARFMQQLRTQVIEMVPEIVALFANARSRKPRHAAQDHACRMPGGVRVDDTEGSRHVEHALILRQRA